MKNVFIIGSKGIPSNYGGYETFVDQLTKNKKSANIKYHVACMNQKECELTYNDARCFSVKTPNIGPARAIYYDVFALKQCIKYIKDNNIKDAIVYILACRIGPFIGHYKKQLKRLGAKLYVNPDGHEWLRSKWSKPVRKYWKVSERLMVKHADLLICDSINIENYIKKSYSKYKPQTTFIAYGADLTKSKLTDNSASVQKWYKEKQVTPHQYYLIVGRFVPENNYETMIKEFMRSKSKHDLVIITNHEQNPFYKYLLNKTNFITDKRIKFVGTVYDKELIKKIRENAYGYLHGHEVGGTNPSLIEALASTKLNLLLNVGFNKEVGEESALYWNKSNYNLAKLIDECDNFQATEIASYDKKSTKRVTNAYTWEIIVAKYEEVFNNE